jgi:transcriptional regulator with XRE-family HTH domain
MKKVIPQGAVIKSIREQSERCSTQKELAYAVGISERFLRQIENTNAAVTVQTLERLAKALGVHREQIAFSIGSPRLATTAENIFDTALKEMGEDHIVPRHDYDIASASTDAAPYYESACRSQDLSVEIMVDLNEETSAYAEELVAILTGLTRSVRGILNDVPATEAIAIQRRLRQLLVLLKGNDVWVYETDVYRRLPERYTVAPDDEPSTREFRQVIAFGPAGAYGETTMRVPIDHGQPFFLAGWNPTRKRAEA